MLRQAAALVGYVAMFALLLLVPAGDMRWADGWILLAVLLAVRVASLILLWRTRSALLAARSLAPLPQPGQSAADRFLLPLYMAAFAGIVVFSAWDARHRLLLGAPPGWLRPVGLLAFAAGWWPIHLALRENAFALTVVRHQPDRGQHVVDTGPYAVVRHPMYAGVSVVMVGVGLWLGSVAGALAAAVPVGLLALRIVFEERVLREQLPGYDAYTRRVRARLVPGVW